MKDRLTFTRETVKNIRSQYLSEGSDKDTKKALKERLQNLEAQLRSLTPNNYESHKNNTV